LAFEDLADRLGAMVDGLPAEDYQFQVYEVGKAHGFNPLRSRFQALYEVHFGSSDGPRFGNFVTVYGVQPTITLLRGNQCPR
jgi:lysyl-tRNA synthetase class 1